MVHAFEDSGLDAGGGRPRQRPRHSHPDRRRARDEGDSKDVPHALVSGTKSMTGHSFGAVGATEGIMCALAIKHKIVPPTINLENLAEDCEELNYVGSEPIEAPDLKAAISNSMGFGGHNVVIAFTSVE